MLGFVVVPTPLPWFIGWFWLIEIKLVLIELENEPLFGEFNKAETWPTERPFNWLTVKVSTVFGDMFDNASTLIDEILLAGRVLKSVVVMPP